MEIFAKDLLLGNFRASDYGVIVASFSYNGNAEEDLGMNTDTIEEFIGHNPTPVYLGYKYSNKLEPQITLVKNPCVYKNEMNFSDYDCRAILREVTSIRGYQWMKLIDDKPSEDIWYKARVNSVSYKRVGSDVAGIILSMECDSSFAWSTENKITINATADKPFYIYNNTDDLNNYILPIVELKTLSTGTFIINNQSENRTSEIKNVKENEIFTMSSDKGILTSSIVHDVLLNDFNMHWIRLLPQKNEFVTNMNAVITFNFRVPRKVGFV